MFTQSVFVQSAVNSLGDTALAYSLTAARWAVLGYDAASTACDWYLQTFFSQEAQARYEEVGESIGLVLVALYQGWMTTCDVIDQHVQACEVKRLPQVEKIDEAPEDDFVIDDYMDDEEIFAESISHESYLDRKIELEDMTLKALVPLATDLNLVTRKVRKGVLVEAILKAEGYEA
jgi:hypothetical protein